LVATNWKKNVKLGLIIGEVALPGRWFVACSKKAKPRRPVRIAVQLCG